MIVTTGIRCFAECPDVCKVLFTTHSAKPTFGRTPPNCIGNQAAFDKEVNCPMCIVGSTLWQIKTLGKPMPSAARGKKTVPCGSLVTTINGEQYISRIMFIVVTIKIISISIVIGDNDSVGGIPSEGVDVANNSFLSVKNQDLIESVGL